MIVTPITYHQVYDTRSEIQRTFPHLLEDKIVMPTTHQVYDTQSKIRESSFLFFPLCRRTKRKNKIK